MGQPWCGVSQLPQLSHGPRVGKDVGRLTPCVLKALGTLTPSFTLTRLEDEVSFSRT